MKATGLQYALLWSKPDNFVDVKDFMIKIYQATQKGKKLQ